MALTRMQPAIESASATASARGGGHSNGTASRLAEQSRRLLVVQFGGAAGTLDKLGDRADAVRKGAGRAAWPRRRAAMAQPA